jgi:hypothetical protein
MITYDERERTDMVKETITLCRQIIEDGWEDENFKYVETNVKKILFDLGEKLGWPDPSEIEKRLRGLKDKFGPGQIHLETAIGYMVSAQREWLEKLGSSGQRTAPAKKWDDIFEA